MTARNDHTGDLIQSKKTTDEFRDNMQRIIDEKKRREEAENAEPVMDPHNTADTRPRSGDFVR